MTTNNREKIMSNNSKVPNRKDFCKDVSLHLKYHGGTIEAAVKARRAVDALASQFAFKTCRNWFINYTNDKNFYNYDNAVAVSHTK